MVLRGIVLERRCGPEGPAGEDDFASRGTRTDTASNEAAGLAGGGSRTGFGIVALWNGGDARDRCHLCPRPCRHHRRHPRCHPRCHWHTNCLVTLTQMYRCRISRMHGSLPLDQGAILGLPADFLGLVGFVVLVYGMAPRASLSLSATGLKLSTAMSPSICAERMPLNAST